MLEWSEACAGQRPEDLGRVERVHVRRLRALQPQLSKLLDEKRIAQGGEQPAGAERRIRGVGEKASLERRRDADRPHLWTSTAANGHRWQASALRG